MFAKKPSILYIQKISIGYIIPYLSQGGEYGLMLPYNLKHEGHAFSLPEIKNV